MGKCQFQDAAYCIHHDYDHVLERNEGRFVSVPAPRSGDGRMPIVKREAFHHFSSGLIVAEASDLGWGATPAMFAVPDRTGRLRMFTLASVDRDVLENEITGWRFADTSGLQVLVVND